MKFKNIKKKGEREEKKKPQKAVKKLPLASLGKKQESPKIYRFITESHLVRVNWQRKEFWLQVVSVVSLFGFLIVCGSIYDYSQVYSRVQKERVAVAKRLSEWDQVNTEHPGYRDGLLQEAMILYQMGDYEKSRDFTQKALDIDPNYIPSQRLAAYLGMTQKEKLEN